jgi:histidinol phosphatase-like enzyme (inositol monophosphatase family)
MDSDALLALLDSLGDAACDSIMPYFRAGGAVENKAVAGFDPVTAADREAEAAIRRIIKAACPGHGIIGEEFGAERPDADYVWVLDPIDGTRAFITGLPVWGTLIGLLHEGRPVLGMMVQPFTGERYAGDGKAAWYRRGDGPRRPIRTRPCAAIGEAALFTTSPYLFDGDDEAAFRRVQSSVRLARYGCDCYAYAMVAGGHADVVVEAGLKDFDVVAMIPNDEGAGGRYTSWEGGSAAGGGRVVASGDARLHEQVLARLASAG